MRLRSPHFPMFPVLILTTVTTVCGCHKKPAPPVESVPAEAAVTEETENGTIAWDVAPDGKVRAVVKALDGHQITTGVTGILTWPGDAGDQIAEVSLTPDGSLVAEGPPLEDDLTQIDYQLDVEGKPWVGTMHVPRGGTKALDDDAKASAAVQVPDGKVGPNGGVIQVLGQQPVEVVADRDTHEMRIFVLGPNYEVVDPGERRFHVGYVAEAPETVRFVREPGAMYYVAPWRPLVDPFRVTVSMHFGFETHVGVVGWRFGVPLMVGVRAPVIRIASERHWIASPVVGVRFGFHGGGYYGHPRVAGLDVHRGGRGPERGDYGGRHLVGDAPRGVRGPEHGDRDVQGGHADRGDHGGGRAPEHGDRGGGHAGNGDAQRGGGHAPEHGDHGGGHAGNGDAQRGGGHAPEHGDRGGGNAGNGDAQRGGGHAPEHGGRPAGGGDPQHGSDHGGRAQPARGGDQGAGHGQAGRGSDHGGGHGSAAPSHAAPSGGDHGGRPPASGGGSAPRGGASQGGRHR